MRGIMDGKALHSIRMWEISTQDGSVLDFAIPM